jgi:REP-associated tyrosine transposase
VSHARQVFPGATLVVARRCSEQRFFMIPRRRVNLVLAFLLGHYAAKHGIELHGFVFMSNHFHLVLTDTRGRLPLFMGEFDSMVTRVLNHELGRRGTFWEAGSYTSLPLKTQEDVLQQLCYLAANPVEACQVRRPERWRGLISLPSQVGTTRICRPPAGGLFGRGHEDSALPESSTLELTIPPFFDTKRRDRFQSLFGRALDSVCAEVRAGGTRFSGRDAVLRLDPFSVPKSAQAGPSFGLVPALANASAEDKAELKVWRRAVREAFYAWQAGKDPVFPAGAYLMPTKYKARVAPP